MVFILLCKNYDGCSKFHLNFTFNLKKFYFLFRAIKFKNIIYVQYIAELLRALREILFF